MRTSDEHGRHEAIVATGVHPEVSSSVEVNYQVNYPSLHRDEEKMSFGAGVVSTVSASYDVAKGTLPIELVEWPF